MPGLQRSDWLLVQSAHETDHHYSGLRCAPIGLCVNGQHRDGCVVLRVQVMLAGAQVAPQILNLFVQSPLLAYRPVVEQG